MKPSLISLSLIALMAGSPSFAQEAAAPADATETEQPAATEAPADAPAQEASSSAAANRPGAVAPSAMPTMAVIDRRRQAAGFMSWY